MTATLCAAVHVLLALQATQADLRGTVRDALTSEPIKAAVVTLSDLDRNAVTDDSGRYTLQNVPAGPQHLSIDVVGYARRTLHALVPAIGSLEINVALRPQPVPLKPLSVHSPVRMRGVEDADVDVHADRALSIGAIRNHPGMTEPDVFHALGGGEVVIMPESPSGVHIRGGAADQTAYVLDGIPVLSPYHSAGVFSAWNPDALSLLSVSSSFPSPAMPDALAGVVSATTRAPGARVAAQGSFSTTQARMTVDGPVGSSGAGYLLSFRSSYPGMIAPNNEGSYLRGESGDVLVKVEAPVLGGTFRALAYDSNNEIDAAAVSDSSDAQTLAEPRNNFEWHSRSVGGSWFRTAGHTSIDVSGWSVSSDADALWGVAAGSASRMTAKRNDDGVRITLEHRGRATTTAGMRVQRSATSYQVAPDQGVESIWSTRTTAPVISWFVEQNRTIDSRMQIGIATTLAVADGALHFAPRAQARWTASDKVALSASAARLFQFAQSVRNGESLVGNIFPADLYVSARAGVPIARSDQAVLSAEYRPRAGVRVSVQAYRRDMKGLLLVAPRETDPFLESDFESGGGMSRGAALDFTLAGSRFGVLSSYGWQQTRFTYGDSSYIPDFAAAHTVETGIIVFPTTTSSIRVNAVAAFGRRGTMVTSGLEWEACNLIDRGCEFAGSPRSEPTQLGATRLPAYLRVDAGVRKHWHFALAGRDATFALFGTVTNLFARRNVLNIAPDPATGRPAAIEMRPLSPLVIGIDWRF